MVLKNDTTQKIKRFVYEQPRTVQEISNFIKKNWRTADRYVEQISREDGSILTKTFRGGTRGALKIVFWNNSEKVYSSRFQEKLLERILNSRNKEDFSPFDIYQYVEDKKRNAFAEKQEYEAKKVRQDLFNLFRDAKKQIFIFSGNLSWANLKQNKETIADVLEELAKKKIDINILTNVDATSLENTEKVLAINERIGREAIKVRHAQQPLRAFIVDDKLARFKEVKNPELNRKGEMKKTTFIFYEIFDKEWILWLQKVFWHIFHPAILAEKRLDDLRSIHRLK
ncbi:hypothetical protein J4414_01990 [Candidatus Woesearchaeota archaeon]|nr:hypothetical protein [Candidatus Woesearchaeota archaeon]